MILHLVEYLQGNWIRRVEAFPDWESCIVAARLAMAMGDGFVGAACGSPLL